MKNEGGLELQATNLVKVPGGILSSTWEHHIPLQFQEWLRFSQDAIRV